LASESTPVGTPFRDSKVSAQGHLSIHSTRKCLLGGAFLEVDGVHRAVGFITIASIADGVASP